MIPSRRTSMTTLGAAVLASLVILVADVQIELGVAASVLYIVVIWIVSSLRRTGWIWISAAICTVLTVAGYLLSPEGGILWQVLINRLLAVGAIWIMGLQCAHRVRLERAQFKLNRELEYRVSMQTTELQQAKRALEQSNEELQQFAYVASHDLQTPLRTIAGFAEFLQEDYAGQLDAEGNDHLRRIIEGTQRMKLLIHDLLAYSRVDAQEATFHTVDLNDVVDGAVHMLHSSIQNADATITRDNLPKVTGDTSQLSQLVQNLIGNALKYRGDERPTIHISSEQVANRWDIAFTDNGMGIEPAEQEQVFEVFHRLHSHDSYPGTGIGLAICRRIASRHGGEIRVDSTPGQGSSFVVSLPIIT